jgi:hypothetical protein
VDVDPERLPAWLNGFAVRHGGYKVTEVDEALHVEAGDRTALALWPPPGAALTGDIEAFVVEAMRERRLGLLLARQASVAVGVAEGPRLKASKVETFYVQARTAAGGWSQQRYARRRSNQARAAAEGAADVTVRLLLPELAGAPGASQRAPASEERTGRAGNTADLAALVAGGDRRTVDAILADPRLAPVAKLRAERFLAVGEPRHKVLEEAVALARAVRILIHDPPL